VCEAAVASRTIKSSEGSFCAPHSILSALIITTAHCQPTDPLAFDVLKVGFCQMLNGLNNCFCFCEKTGVQRLSNKQLLLLL
jgi:hypothetical protein